MTMKLSRVPFLHSLLLATVCTACTLQQTTPVTPAPAGVQSLVTPREEPEAPASATPQLAIGQDGRLYLLWLVVEYRKNWDVLFSRSEDRGVTWLPPVSLKPDKRTVAGGIRIAAGPAGHVYATWREWDPKAKVRRLQFVRSQDHGMHWDQSRRSAGVSDDAGMPQLLADQNGGVYLSLSVGPRPPRAIEVASSHDFGATFASTPSRLATAFPASQHSRYGIMFHRFASDGEGRLYVVWEETRAARDHRIYLNRSLDGGQTWEVQPTLLSAPDDQGERLTYHPQIVTATNGRVYVAWEQDEFRKSGAGRPDRLIYINRSDDYGQTWLPKPIRLNGIEEGRVASSNPRLSSDQHGNVYVIWIEEAGLRRSQLFFSRSGDSGSTWSAPTRLDLSSPSPAWLALSEVRSDDTGHVWVLWQAINPSLGGWRLLMNRSEDFGRSWSKQVTVLNEPAQRGEAFTDVSFQNDLQGRLYVAWAEGLQNSQEISVNRSADFGATWLPREIRIGRR